jgi:putative transposase
MTDTEIVARKRDREPADRPPLVDAELADELLARAQTDGVELLGPDGLLSQVTKAVLERALAEEMTAHLGYDKHDPAGRGSGNSRNGVTGKRLLTEIGGIDLEVPRDRAGSFSPQIVRKGQTRLDGFNDRIIALYARGLTTRDIRAHLREMYDVDVSPDLISRVTDAVLEELQEWQSRPLDRGRLSGGVHRRTDGQDPRRCRGEPAGVYRDRDRLRGREERPRPVGRTVHW